MRSSGKSTYWHQDAPYDAPWRPPGYPAWFSGVRRALDDAERGLGGRQLEIEDTAMRHLVERANGDARAALNSLELAADAAEASGSKLLGLALIEDAVQQRALLYDKGGDAHYDT